MDVNELRAELAEETQIVDANADEVARVVVEADRIRRERLQERAYGLRCDGERAIVGSAAGPALDRDLDSLRLRVLDDWAECLLQPGEVCGAPFRRIWRNEDGEQLR